MSENQNSDYLLRIENMGDLAIGLEQLQQIDPALVPIIAQLPEVPLRLRPPGFHGLAEIITAQQVSKASATAIFGRLTDLIKPFDAPNFLAAGDAPLIEAGLSRAKQSTLTGLAEAIGGGELDLEVLCSLPIDTALENLTALKGIGPWTAEVFLLFCAGHADIFPAGDIALQHTVGDICGLDEKPDIKQARELAKRWAPLRGVASRVLYAHYAFVRNRVDVPI